MSINGMIGAGIFAMPAILFSSLGHFAPWMILIVGLLVGAGTLIMADLASHFRQSGGPQLYAQVAYGSAAGFQAGWLLLLAIIASRAANFHVLVTYLAAIFPFFSDSLTHTATVLLLIAVLTWINILGMKQAVGALVAGTVLKLTPILLICLVAFAQGGIVTEFKLPEFGAIEGTALLIYYAYSGTIANSYAAGEVKNPRRTIPRTMLMSLGLIIVLYMVVQFAFNAVAPDTGGSDTPLAALGGALLGETGALIMALAAIFSIATNQHTFYMTGPRILFGMARRGLLPRVFTHLSEKRETPDLAIYFFSGLVAILSLSGGFVFLAEVQSLGSQIVLLMCFGAFVILRKNGHTGEPRPIGPKWWVILFLAAGYSIFASAQAGIEVYAMLALLVVVGTGLYFVARRGETSAPEPEFD